MSEETVFETERLRIRTAAVADAELLHRLWTDPQVMSFVGFPRGLSITASKVADDLADQKSSGAFDRCLLVELRSTGEVIGECRLGSPDEAGIAETDVKLFPEHWGHRYGVEVKRGLVDHLFATTDCGGRSKPPPMWRTPPRSPCRRRWVEYVSARSLSRLPRACATR